MDEVKIGGLSLSRENMASMILGRIIFKEFSDTIPNKEHPDDYRSRDITVAKDIAHTIGLVMDHMDYYIDFANGTDSEDAVPDILTFLTGED